MTLLSSGATISPATSSPRTARAHIESLCKWGPTTSRIARRVLPSGRPPEKSVTLVQDDPTWALEYEHFKHLVGSGAKTDLANDRWLLRVLGTLLGARRDKADQRA